MRHTRATALLAVIVLGGCDATNTTTSPPNDWPTDFDVCAEERFEASFVPVNLLLTIDRSQSMSDGQPVPKWEAATSAISSFLQAPDADQLDVALRIWPDPDGCNTSQCDAAACSDPQVALGPLGDPTHLAEVVGALESAVPSGETPLSAAVDGAARWADAQLSATPKERAAIVVVTDGIPNGCDEDVDHISAFAAQAAAAGAPVFAVGIDGSSEAVMNQISAAGGTGRAYLVGKEKVEQELLATLLDIQGQVLGCIFQPPIGEELDYDKIRIELEAAGSSTVIPRVNGVENCHPVLDGWYLDGNERIALCEHSCEAVQAAGTAALAVTVGCECQQDSDCATDEVCTDNACVPCEGAECPGADTGDAGAANVQGGAQNCETVPGPGGWIAALAFFFLARRRS